MKPLMPFILPSLIMAAGVLSAQVNTERLPVGSESGRVRNGVETAAGGDHSALEWGPATNGVQLAIWLKNDAGSVKTNEPVGLLIKIKNVSTNEILHMYTWQATKAGSSLSMVVESPQGDHLSPAAEFSPNGSGWLISVPPDQVYQYDFNLTYLCKFNDFGTYTITAKELIGRDDKDAAWVISNPLSFTVVPGEWKTTNAAPSGF
jgi:hypothetical protein